MNPVNSPNGRAMASAIMTDKTPPKKALRSMLMGSFCVSCLYIINIIIKAGAIDDRNRIMFKGFYVIKLIINKSSKVTLENECYNFINLVYKPTYFSSSPFKFLKV